MVDRGRDSNPGDWDIGLVLIDSIETATSLFVAICSDRFVKSSEPARIRTWNLLIRSQTRYPLRHKALDVESGNAKVFIIGPPTTIQNETSTDSSYPLFIFN